MSSGEKYYRTQGSRNWVAAIALQRRRMGLTGLGTKNKDADWKVNKIYYTKLVFSAVQMLFYCHEFTFIQDLCNFSSISCFRIRYLRDARETPPMIAESARTLDEIYIWLRGLIIAHTMFDKDADGGHLPCIDAEKIMRLPCISTTKD